MARKTKVRTDNYVEQAIVQLLSLKFRAGATLEDLRSLVEKCLKQVDRMSRSPIQSRGLDIHRLGSVLRAWHKDTQYLTADGLPRPLKFDGRSGLRNLVRRFYPAEKFDVVLQRMLETKLVRRNGKEEWVPSGRTATIPQVSHETLDHFAEGVVRYVETVTRNITAKREQDVLFERSCKVTKLPVAKYDAFREFVGQQALAFILAIDDWLENRVSTSSNSRGGTCTAGVYTFAYVAR